jgi:(2Fe-2S) ferredoxin
MKVYFSGSLYYKDQFINRYNRIVEILKKNGCTVYEDTTKLSFDDAVKRTDDERINNYKNIVKWIDLADCSVIEGSYPSSLHIGHEITLTLEKNKPVIILYTKGSEPTVLRGLKDEKIIWAEYDNDNIEKVIEKAIIEAKKVQDVRFNFFVSPKILAYLDWVAQKRMVPRSVFLRDLIEKEMKKDKEFKG